MRRLININMYAFTGMTCILFYCTLKQIKIISCSNRIKKKCVKVDIGRLTK